jgi:DNA-binding MarR family transcriptional regulator
MTAPTVDERFREPAPPAGEPANPESPSTPENSAPAATQDALEAGANAARPSRDDVVLVADTLIGLFRAFNRTRARLLAAAAHDVEWSAHILLKCVATEGPSRASALAEALQSDPSTVSRQVASLVKEGLLERRADPEDGRASLLVTTRKAAEVLANHDEIRVEHFTRMLTGWPEDDLRRFAELLQRFTTDYDRANHDWLTAKIDGSLNPHAAQDASPEGNG